MRQTVFLLIGYLLVAGVLSAQENPVIRATELVYDFGIIAEEDGPVSHVFVVENKGSNPLVITRVTASCGCTRPEWTKAPIASGKTGEVKITYDPKGRPGPFVKTASIYSNGNQGSYKLAVKGTVTPKKIRPAIIYPYAIGPLKMHTKTVLYSGIRPEEVLGEKIMIKNEGEIPVAVRIGKHPGYLTIGADPQSLIPGEEGEITILFNARELKKHGRVTAMVPLVVQAAGFSDQEGMFRVSANVIDDFSKLSATEKENAPVIKLASETIDFGTVGESGGKISRKLEITNTGKSDLHIRSIGSDDERIDVSGGKKTIKPGATVSFKIVIRAKEVKASLESVLSIVCNDPDSPVRLIKVTAKQ